MLRFPATSLGVADATDWQPDLRYRRSNCEASFSRAAASTSTAAALC